MRGAGQGQGVGSVDVNQELKGPIIVKKYQWGVNFGWALDLDFRLF